MSSGDRKAAWGGAALLVIALAIWLYPVSFDIGITPGNGFGTTPGVEGAPQVPSGIGGLAALAFALGVGLAWYVPWLGSRLQNPAGRVALGTFCVLIGLPSPGSLLLLPVGIRWLLAGAWDSGGIIVLLGLALLALGVASVRGAMAVVDKSAFRPQNESTYITPEG